MAGLSGLKKQLRFKPIGKGIQLLAFVQSSGGSQYLYDFEIDHNDKEPGKVQNTLLRLVKRLPSNSKGHCITADNLFNSVDTCSKVRALGHWIYGTIRMDCGVPQHLKEHIVEPL
eukprot:461536-Rhodomonas_salina.1